MFDLLIEWIDHDRQRESKHKRIKPSCHQLSLHAVDRDEEICRTLDALRLNRIDDGVLQTVAIGGVAENADRDIHQRHH